MENTPTTDARASLGDKLLKRLAALHEQKGTVSAEDVGGMVTQLVPGLNLNLAKADEEIRMLAQYITDAKQEIFSTPGNEKRGTGITDASLYLDEVLKETEQASHSIMDAAETIQNALEGNGGKEQIRDATKRIYEACNFQDITGQRITRVIRLLGNIEERVARLSALFGHAPSSAKNAAHVMGSGNQDLLNGPQLQGHAPTQAEIDRLFASLGGKK